MPNIGLRQSIQAWRLAQAGLTASRPTTAALATNVYTVQRSTAFILAAPTNWATFDAPPPMVTRNGSSSHGVVGNGHGGSSGGGSRTHGAFGGVPAGAVGTGPPGQAQYAAPPVAQGRLYFEPATVSAWLTAVGQSAADVA